MAELDVLPESHALGFNEERLSRIGGHLDRYVREGRLAGYQVLVSRFGQALYSRCHGHRDTEAELPVEIDTRWRIFSMTKPVTAVAAMMLYERGAFELTDPIAWYLPEFTEMRVYSDDGATVRAKEPIRIWHLLTHTAGFTYGFHRAHPVDARYRASGFDLLCPPGRDLAGCCEVLADLPLLFEPGTEWNYSVASDVLGRLIEVVSGRPFDAFLAEHVFGPLGMVDTGFHVPSDAIGKLAALYVPDPTNGRAARHDGLSLIGAVPPGNLSGGGGLVSTAADYHRFTRMLLSNGELDGNRLLSERSLALMTRNHLPGGAELRQVGRPGFTETLSHGVGYGLGFSVLLDPIRAKTLSTAGEYAWGGAASTAFWVDPVEKIITLFFTQLLPSTTYPIRSQLRQLVYEALEQG